MICQGCGHSNHVGSAFCERCGVKLVVSSRACPRCGGDNNADMRFCVHCGLDLRPPAAEPSIRPGKSGPLLPSSPMAVPGLPPLGKQCGRCARFGEAGADRCLFCGARYDEPAAARAEAPPRSELAVRGGPQAKLTAILKDGSDGPSYIIGGPTADIGRSEGDVRLPEDPYLNPRHARLSCSGDRWTVRDLDSVNGVYIRLREPWPLVSGDLLLVGQQVLRLELLDETELSVGPANERGVRVFGTPEVQRFARLVQYTTEGIGRDVYSLYREETVLGRETGDVVFTDDPFMSRRHASLTYERASRRLTLRDLGSSNGTAVRIRAARELRPGDQFRVGRHLFRFDTHGDR